MNTGRNQIEGIMYDTKVLYVEDNDETRKHFTDILKELFSDVIIAKNGKEALKLYREKKPDLIITDINMPVMSGIDLVKKIRETDKDVSIIILSAHNEADILMEAIKFSVDGYVLKPLDLEQFLETVEKIATKIKLQKENSLLIQLLKQYQEAMDRFFIISKTDTKGKITYVNTKFEEISQYKKEELIGKKHSLIKHPDMPKEFFADMWRTIKNGKIWTGIVKNRKKSGEPYYVKTLIFPVKDEKGNIVEFFSIRQDITKEISPVKQLNISVNPEKANLIIIVKIKNYTYLEDLYTFEKIDELEKKFIRIIRESLPQKCKVKDLINMGEGEFVIVRFSQNLTDDNVEDIIQKIKTLSWKIQKKISDITDYDLEVGVSMAYGKDAYRMAKYGIRKLQNTPEDFIVVNKIQDKIRQKASENLKILKKVKTAVNKGNLKVMYQPILNAKTGKIEMFESLVRVVDKDNKLLTPYQFLDIVKKTKYYSEITKFVLKKALEAQHKLNAKITINLSYTDIERDEIRNYIINTLAENKNLANRIIFEIVETEDTKNLHLVDEFISQIKKKGAKIAIDDFGTGYSNLERVISYKPDIIKIDGGLIKNILTGKPYKRVVESIIEFCKKERFSVVAEFIENKEMYDLLTKMGADYLQGYYIGKPQEIKQYLKGRAENEESFSSGRQYNIK